MEKKDPSTLKKESLMSIGSKANKVKPTKANIVVVPFSNLKLTGEPLLSKSPSNRSNLSIVRENEITTGAYNISQDETFNDSSKPLEFFVGLPSPPQSLSPRSTTNMNKKDQIKMSWQRDAR